MGKRTGRPRGALVGNTNRLKHGRYSRAHCAELAEVSALIRESRALVRRALLFLKLRKVLEGKWEREVNAPSASLTALAQHLPRKQGRIFPLPACGEGLGWGSKPRNCKDSNNQPT